MYVFSGGDVYNDINSCYWRMSCAKINTVRHCNLSLGSWLMITQSYACRYPEYTLRRAFIVTISYFSLLNSERNCRETTTHPRICCLRKVSAQLNSFTTQLILIKVMRKRLIAINSTRDANVQFVYAN